jgi:hypothetical protein
MHTNLPVTTPHFSIDLIVKESTLFFSTMALVLLARNASTSSYIKLKGVAHSGVQERRCRWESKQTKSLLKLSHFSPETPHKELVHNISDEAKQTHPVTHLFELFDVSWPHVKMIVVTVPSSYTAPVRTTSVRRISISCTSSWTGSTARAAILPKIFKPALKGKR